MNSRASSSKETKCSAGHSTSEIGYQNKKNIISYGYCDLCTKEHFIEEFKTWSSGNVEIDKIIQECQTNNGYNLQWIPYDNFQDIKHIANGGYGSVHSTILKNGVKRYWDLNGSDWNYCNVGDKVALKEINDSKDDVSIFIKEVQNIQTVSDLLYVAICLGISKNPITQNFIIVMELYDNSLHKFLKDNFWKLRWELKLYLLYNIAGGLNNLHMKNLAHCDLHAGNILTKSYSDFINSNLTTIADFGSCSLDNDSVLKSDNKSNKIYGSIPYIPPEVLRGDTYSKKGDIYSFGGIMYEMATGKQPFYDQAHDTRLIINIYNEERPKIPDHTLDWIPKFYIDLMHRCWSNDPSKRPTAQELYDVLWNLFEILLNNKVEDDLFHQFKTADENKEAAIKSLKRESPSSSYISHSQSCYFSRTIYTLFGLHESLEDIKSGKSQDPNLLSIRTYEIDSKELQECIDWEKEIIQNHAKKRSSSALESDSDKENNTIFKKAKKVGPS
ncbi:hypothetical protein Glove_54g167 [Diversispora epigaea]|uniref:Protein kinase domain-containing protein n=1 Tax=Diversispora epigaea TaxID=1348612 RepID=A0A397JDJ8_9GLOM|nr:hypothetical protein Glove_54g167 [Diversispora epigaea]